MSTEFKPLGKPNITDEELLRYELYHRIAGNGLYFVRHLGDDMCHTCWCHPQTGVGTVFLTATAMLTPHMVPDRPATKEDPHPPKIPSLVNDGVRLHIEALRGKLERGEAEIRNQRVVAL